MRHKALFKFVVKVCGLVMALIGLSIFSVQAIDLLSDLMRRETYGYYQIRSLFYCVPYIGVGTYLCFWGNWIADKAFPAGPKCCPACGYQARGNISGVCSECGSVLPPEFKEANHE